MSTTKDKAVHPLLEGTTPGPWEVIDREAQANGFSGTVAEYHEAHKAESFYLGCGMESFTIISTSEHREVADPRATYNGNRDVAMERANAKLIAASPLLAAENQKMRAALELLPLDAFREGGEGADAADFPDNASHFIAAMDAAREVLASLTQH